jgi:hypothetical protein
MHLSGVGVPSTHLRYGDPGQSAEAATINAVPSDVIVGLEIPQLSLAEAGVSPIDRLRPCVEAARAVL